MALTYEWTIKDDNGVVSTHSGETAPAVDVDSIAAAYDAGECGIFPVGFESTLKITDECGSSDEEKFSTSYCYVFGPDGSVLLCGGVPFSFDPGACGCES